MDIKFAGELLPEEASTDHFCFIGCTGSGKTVLITQLMQSVFPNRIGKGDHAVVYDVKRDMFPILCEIAPNQSVILNPFDSRCYIWDMAQDLTEPAHALEFSNILIPENKNEKQPFFNDSARHLLAAVITVFIFTANKKWTFRDVINVMFRKNLLQKVLASKNETKHLLDLYFDNEKTAKDIMSTIATKLGQFSIIAALWDYRIKKAKEHGEDVEKLKFSLVKWLDSKGSILILGNSHTNQVAVDSLNRVIFKRVSQLVLDKEEIKKADKSASRFAIPLRDEEVGSNKIWFIFDEFVRIGKLDGVVQLTTEGRSKGASVVLGFQDINGVREVYGKEIAEEIIGQCSNLAFLKAQSPDTAEWMSNFVGSYRIMEEIVSKSKNINLKEYNVSKGDSVRVEQKDYKTLLPSVFRLLRKPEKSQNIDWIEGYFVSDKKPFYSRVVGINVEDVFKDLPKLNVINKGFLPYTEEESKDAQILAPFNSSDYSNLGLREIEKEVNKEERKEAQRKEDNKLRDLAEAIKWRGYPTDDETEEMDNLTPKQRITFDMITGVKRQSSAKQDQEDDLSGIKITLKKKDIFDE